MVNHSFMKRIISFVLCLALAGTAVLRAQEYPFQDTKLSEEERQIGRAHV